MSESILALLRNLFSREKTLSELMAEQGRNEFGRVAPAGAQPTPVFTLKSELSPQGFSGQKVLFVTEVSYDKPGQLRVGVVGLNNREFRGVVDGEDEVRTFSWGKVRGLMRIVDTGEMLSPYEVYDHYH